MRESRVEVRQMGNVHRIQSVSPDCKWDRPHQTSVGQAVLIANIGSKVYARTNRGIFVFIVDTPVDGRSNREPVPAVPAVVTCINTRLKTLKATNCLRDQCCSTGDTVWALSDIGHA
jgi:hypothetical protein